MATFLELLDAGLCTGGCMMATPDTRCDCHCGGWLHSTLVRWLNGQWVGQFEYARYPGFSDIAIIHKDRRVRAADPEHPRGGWAGRLSA